MAKLTVCHGEESRQYHTGKLIRLAAEAVVAVREERDIAVNALDVVADMLEGGPEGSKNVACAAAQYARAASRIARGTPSGMPSKK